MAQYIDRVFLVYATHLSSLNVVLRKSVFE